MCVSVVLMCISCTLMSLSIMFMHQDPCWFPNTPQCSCQRQQRLIICAPRTSCSCVTWSAWHYHNHQFYFPPTGKCDCFLNSHIMRHWSKAYYTKATVAGFANACSTQVPQHKLAVLLGRSWVSVVPNKPSPTGFLQNRLPFVWWKPRKGPIWFS